MLDDPDGTNTKSIENYFGNLDREIRNDWCPRIRKVNDYWEKWD